MQAERWTAVEKLFHEIADLPASEQEARLAQAEPEIAAEVRSLIEPGSKMGSLAELISSVAGAAITSRLPQRFGPWRVTGVIGHGGMGAVYKAERDDNAFDKQVAIKVLQFGLDTPTARERFRQERSILATLEHPHIARLLDGGETESGLSYIVLEYVDGEPITRYCENNRLSRQARLKLFLQVAASVQYAHQALVIHRDLKPSNILTTKDGTAKLLDFGIAKLLEPDSVQTMTGFLALTPQYASPEQIRGEAVTTASDVYSLGLILYEMLTGRKPYEVDATSVSKIARMVCEEEPAAPGIDDDLDNILMMALRKEPARRYASAAEFAADIERSMAHQPVRARPDSFRYRAGKFLRRNSIAVGAAALVLVSLSTGLGVALHQARIANERFADVRELANSFIAFDGEIANIPGTVKARQTLVTKALRYLDKLSGDAAGDDSLTAEVAAAYEKVGDVQGTPNTPSLGMEAEGLRSYRKAQQLWEKIAAKKPLYARRLASNWMRISEYLAVKEDPGELPAVRKAIAIQDRLGPDSGITWSERAMAQAALYRGLDGIGQGAEALAASERSTRFREHRRGAT